MCTPAPGLSWIAKALSDLDSSGTRRSLLQSVHRRPARVRIHSTWLDDFTSNDYLGLSHHPLCSKAARLAASTHGCGSGGSRLVTGGGPHQAALEQLLSDLYCGTALLFPSGYQANLGAITSLSGPGSTILSDQHNHASIVDACRLSGANIQVYPHRDTTALAALLDRSRGRRLIVTDSLFSMTGDLAPIAHLSHLSEIHQVPLLVDEAHAIGVLGPSGLGLCAAEGVQPALLMGTFSKALGSHGAFTISSSQVADWLINRARSFIYTTALPPPVLAASHQSLLLATGDLGHSLRQSLRALSDQLHADLTPSGLRPTGQGTPILSLSFDDTLAATRLQARLLELGHLAWAFRPPSVPAGTSHLRISLSAAHDPAQVAALARSILSATSTSEEIS